MYFNDILGISPTCPFCQILKFEIHFVKLHYVFWKKLFLGKVWEKFSLYSVISSSQSFRVLSIESWMTSWSNVFPISLHFFVSWWNWMLNVRREFVDIYSEILNCSRQKLNNFFLFPSTYCEIFLISSLAFLILTLYQSYSSFFLRTSSRARM